MLLRNCPKRRGNNRATQNQAQTKPDYSPEEENDTAELGAENAWMYEDSVTVQDEQKELVEDRYVVLLHHHPNNSAASLADLDATKWMKAEFLLVSNQDGTLHRYARVNGELIPLEPTRNPEYAAPVDPLETALADAAYLIQTLSELGNPPERVMLQEPNEDEITINTDSRLVDEFAVFDYTYAI